MELQRGVCGSENEKIGINPNDMTIDVNTIDRDTEFWKNCYKIKSINFDLGELLKI